MIEAQLKKELAEILNKSNIDNLLGVPDFILAEYLFNTLLNLKLLINKTDNWKGKDCP